MEVLIKEMYHFLLVLINTGYVIIILVHTLFQTLMCYKSGHYLYPVMQQLHLLFSLLTLMKMLVNVKWPELYQMLFYLFI